MTAMQQGGNKQEDSPPLQHGIEPVYSFQPLLFESRYLKEKSGVKRIRPALQSAGLSGRLDFIIAVRGQIVFIVSKWTVSLSLFILPGKGKVVSSF